MIGIMANAARHEPEAVAALRAGRDDKVNRILRLPLPEPYSPTRLEAFRDRKRARPKSASKSASKSAEAPRKSAGSPGRKPSRKADGPLRSAPPRTAGRPARQTGGNARSRARHHVSGQRYASQGAGLRQPRRSRALEGQRYG
jgi:cell division protein FtsW